MLIECQKCGFENQQGTLFCKNCGTKLDLDRIDEMIRKRSSGVNIKNRFKSIFRLIAALIIILILYLIFSIIYPSFTPLKVSTLSKEQQSQATLKLQSMELKRGNNYTFSLDEINVLYNKNFISKKQRQYPLGISIDSANNFVFKLRKPLHEKVPFDLDYVVVGKPLYEQHKGKSSLTGIEIESVKLGSLPIPKILRPYILEMFKPYVTKRLNRTLGKISKAELNDDQEIEIIIHSKNQ